jgi:rod shape-determining protein MreD
VTGTLAPRQGGLVILLTFCAALMLMILPLPEWARPYRPQWVSLTLIYWTLAVPHRVGVGTGFVSGILLDVLTGTVLGQHALGLTIIAYIGVKLHQRVRLFPLWQQALIVLSMLVLEHLVTLWVMGALRKQPPGLAYWLVPLIGALLWPWLYIVLRDLRRRFNVR